MLFPVSLLQAQKIAQHDALTVEELQADLDVFLDVYDHHPGLHLYHTLEETDSVKAALQHLIQNGTSTSILYRIAAGTDLSGRRAHRHLTRCCVR